MPNGQRSSRTVPFYSNRGGGEGDSTREDQAHFASSFLIMNHNLSYAECSTRHILEATQILPV